MSAGLIARAIAYAADKHYHQVDKVGAPYILHPLRVMLAVREKGHRAEVQAAAVLHDVVEDTDTTLDEIMSFFGFQVTELVDRMTRREGETYKKYIIRCCESDESRDIKEYDVKDNADLSRYHPESPYGRYVETMCYIRTGKFKPEKK